LTDHLDPDAYLSSDTIIWCQQALDALGHSDEPRANEFIAPERVYLVPTWYRQLLTKARDHVRSGEEPPLAIAPSPPEWLELKESEDAIAELQNEADTFGLAESLHREDTDREDTDISSSVEFG